MRVFAVLFPVLLLFCYANVAWGIVWDTNACGSFFTVTTYSNVTKATGAPQFKLGLIGSYQVSNMSEKVSMMKFATDYINNQTAMLPNVSLQLVGTQISGVKSNTILAGLAAVTDNVRVMIGGASDVETEAVYAISSRYSVLQVSPFSNSAKYVNSSIYPTLLQVPGSLLQQTEAVAGVLNFFGWTRAIVCVGDDENGAYLQSAFQTNKLFNMTYTILKIPTAASSDKNSVSTIRNYLNQTRILVFCTPASTAIRLMPQLNATNLVTPNYVYILCDQITTAYQNNPSSFGASAQYLNGSIMIGPKGQGNNPFYYDIYNTWMAANPIAYPGSRPPSPNTWFAFEAVYMIAKAVDTLVGYGFQSDDITSSLLHQTMVTLDYVGVTGPVNFPDSATSDDRNALWDIFNFYDGELIYKFSTMYTSLSTPYDVVPGNFTFYGGRTDIPVDFVRKNEIVPPTLPPPTPAPILPTYRGYNSGVSGAFGAVVGLCACFAVFAVIVLVMHKKEFEDAYGSMFTIFVITGSFIAYAGAATVLPDRTEALCMAFPWLVGIAFNIVYGCLFVKIWSLFSAFRKGESSTASVSPLHLALSILAFSLVEAVLLIVWTVKDAPQLTYMLMSDSTYELQCHNDKPTFWVIFLAYKGIWVFGGAVLAFLSRRTVEKGSVFKSVSNAIYNDLGLFVVGVPIAIGLSHVYSGTLIIQIALVVLSFTFTMAILFFDIWYKIFFAHKDVVGEVSRKIGALNGPRMPSGTTTSGSKGSKNSHDSKKSSGPNHSPNSRMSMAASSKTSKTSDSKVESKESNAV